MIWTPYHNLTTEELLAEFHHKKDPTDLEVEMALRLQESAEREGDDLCPPQKDALKQLFDDT